MKGEGLRYRVEANIPLLNINVTLRDKKMLAPQKSKSLNLFFKHVDSKMCDRMYEATSHTCSVTSYSSPSLPLNPQVFGVRDQISRKDLTLTKQYKYSSN